MLDKKNKLTENEIRELFYKYDIDKDNTINHSELTKMVTEIYLKSSSLKELNPNDDIIIKLSVDELLKIKDSNKDGKLEIEEFVTHYNGKNIFEQTGT